MLAYRLAFPAAWQIHDVFHSFVLRTWRESVFTAAQKQIVQDIKTKGEQHYETRKILLRRKVHKRTGGPEFI